MTEEPDFKLAGLSVWATAREFEQSDDFWDGNWLHVRACVEASGSQVETIGPWLRIDELARSEDQLTALARNLRGVAKLDCIEPMLSAGVKIGLRGEITVTVEITPDHLTQRHWFEFHIDQSYLTQILSDCRRLLKRFPVRGEPGRA